MNENLPTTSEDNIQARVKEGMGLDFWAKKLLEHGEISQKVFDDFVKKNNSKEDEMRKHGLPQLEHYGAFTSVEEIKEKILSDENARYIIRCKSKTDESIKRLLNATFAEIIEFAKKLPGGFEAWTVEVKEFRETTMAGTLIVEPSGKTTIEMWKGPHYLSTTNCPKYAAEFDPKKFSTHFDWKSSSDDISGLDDAKIYAMDAFKYFFPHLQPKPNDSIYAEFAVDSEGKIYFIEVSGSPLLTGKFNVPQEYE